MSLTEQEIADKKALVQSTWKTVDAALGEEATKLFYQRLFEQYPSVKPLFANTDMKKQAGHLHKTIRIAVSKLNDLDKLVPVLKDLGARHVAYGTQPAHYPAVGETLLWTLEQGLGPSVWTPEVADAWTWVFGIISSTMADGAKAKVAATMAEEVKAETVVAQ